MTGLAVNAAIFAASVVSGLLGIGVAFAALPILSLAGGDLVDELQPVALVLNAVTAFFSAVAFQRAGYVRWRRTARVALVATVVAPFGALAARALDPASLWGAYLAAVGVVIVLGLYGTPSAVAKSGLGPVLCATVPIAFFSAMLGIGPGFLLVPVMLFLGWTAREAAATNAVAVVPSSLAALLPHLGTAKVDIAHYTPTVAVAAIAALVGGHLASRRVPERGLRIAFNVVLVGLAAWKAWSLVFGAG